MLKSLLVAVSLALTATSASAQVLPRLIADQDVFKMEDEAEARWKVALPRINRDTVDLVHAWERLSSRVRHNHTDWLTAQENAMAQSFEHYTMVREMREYCGAMRFITLPLKMDAQAVMLFARIEVRATVCEAAFKKLKTDKKVKK